MSKETDKELLVLAAKAAGYKDIQQDESGFYRVIGENEDGTLCMVQFNPLADDGDALRLAVKLELYIFIDDKKVHVDGPDLTVLERFKDCPYAATRRAIVRAATEIGRKL